MRKVWITLALLGLAGAAQAGPYTDAVRTQQGCEAAGKMGEIAYQARPANASQMSPDDLKAAANNWLEQVNAIRPIPGGEQGRILRKTVEHAFVDAQSDKDAFTYGWAQCMDVYGPQ